MSKALSYLWTVILLYDAEVKSIVVRTLSIIYIAYRTAICTIFFERSLSKERTRQPQSPPNLETIATCARATRPHNPRFHKQKKQSYI
jgi:hypothetical protein